MPNLTYPLSGPLTQKVMCDDLIKFKTIFLGFARYCLNIIHPPYNYGPIIETLKLEPLSERRSRFCRNFIKD